MLPLLLGLATIVMQIAITVAAASAPTVISPAGIYTSDDFETNWKGSAYQTIKLENDAIKAQGPGIAISSTTDTISKSGVYVI